MSKCWVLSNDSSLFFLKLHMSLLLFLFILFVYLNSWHVGDWSSSAKSTTWYFNRMSLASYWRCTTYYSRKCSCGRSIRTLKDFWFIVSWKYRLHRLVLHLEPQKVSVTTTGDLFTVASNFTSFMPPIPLVVFVVFSQLLCSLSASCFYDRRVVPIFWRAYKMCTTYYLNMWKREEKFRNHYITKRWLGNDFLCVYTYSWAYRITSHSTSKFDTNTLIIQTKKYWSLVVN